MLNIELFFLNDNKSMKKTTQENTGDILLGSRVNFRLPMGFS
jgi:hypothetical protein